MIREFTRVLFIFAYSTVCNSGNDHESYNYDTIFTLQTIEGCNLKEPRNIMFSFLFYSKSGAEAAQKYLNKKGFDLELDEHWEGEDLWSGTIRKKVVLEYESITKMTSLFAGVANKNQGEYELWSGGSCYVK